MRQDSRGLLNFHDCRDKIRDIREDCLSALDVVHRLDSKIDEDNTPVKAFHKDRLGMSINDTYFHLQEVRRSLRVVLERTDTSGTLSDEEIDTPSSFSLPSGPARDIFIFLSGELEEVGTELEEDVFPSISEQCLSGFVVQYCSDAVMNIHKATQCINEIVRLLSDEESDTGEEKRFSGSTYQVLPSNQGFQASSRAGQI